METAHRCDRQSREVAATGYIGRVKFQSTITTAVALYVAIIRNRYMELTSRLVEMFYFRSEPVDRKVNRQTHKQWRVVSVTDLIVQVLRFMSYVVLDPPAGRKLRQLYTLIKPSWATSKILFFRRVPEVVKSDYKFRHICVYLSV